MTTYKRPPILRRSIKRIFYYFLIFTLLFAVFYDTTLMSSLSKRLYELPEILSSLYNKVDPMNEEQSSLEDLLKASAMEDKTVILTSINSAWASRNSILDVFIESFQTGIGTAKLLDHLVMVALDKKAYSRCKSIHPHCYALYDEMEDFSAPNEFMSDGYLKLVWKKIDFLRQVLEHGYGFIFSDADIMWFRNPMPFFYPEADFQISCDHFNGREYDLNNNINTGFKYVKSNNRTIEFYKYWYESRADFERPMHDQDVFNVIKYDQDVKNMGLEMKFLDTKYFGGLCEKSKDFNKVCTMHANCCVGLKRKINDLHVLLNDWRKYLSLPPSRKVRQTLEWNAPQRCIYKREDLELEERNKSTSG